jgi:hypothetical protein
MNKLNAHSAGLLVQWALKLPRFFFAAGFTLFLHFQLILFAGWVCTKTAPPNVSPDAGQPWMDRHYVPAYTDYSMAYAIGILLVGNAVTALVFYLLGRWRLLVEWWAIGAAWSVAILGELFSLLFMHPW